MVSLKAVKESNAFLQTQSTGQVALFVGATSGIAMHTLLEYARHSTEPKVYIVGRSEAKLSPLIDNLTKINPEGVYIPLIYSISLLKNVDAACTELQSKKTQVGSAVDVSRLLKVIKNRKSRLTEDDLELRRNFSTRNAAMHTCTMNTLALQEYAATKPTISCVHVFPRVFITNGYDILAEDFPAPLRWMFVRAALPLMKMVISRLEEVGQRHLFHAKSARYPPQRGSGTGYKCRTAYKSQKARMAKKAADAICWILTGRPWVIGSFWRSIVQETWDKRYESIPLRSSSELLGSNEIPGTSLDQGTLTTRFIAL
ncbi:MAG: hypothetical protein Q9207_004351 [Kuettlingeria erythrocarpa]